MTLLESHQVASFVVGLSIEPAFEKSSKDRGVLVAEPVQDLRKMAYTALSDFMGGWFHQDFDIAGETVPEIVRAFRGVTPLGEQKSSRSDIERFLAEHPEDLDGAFEEAFKPATSGMRPAVGFDQDAERAGERDTLRTSRKGLAAVLWWHQATFRARRSAPG